MDEWNWRNGSVVGAQPRGAAGIFFFMEFALEMRVLMTKACGYGLGRWSLDGGVKLDVDLGLVFIDFTSCRFFSVSFPSYLPQLISTDLFFLATCLDPLTVFDRKLLAKISLCLVVPSVIDYLPEAGSTRRLFTRTPESSCWTRLYRD